MSKTLNREDLERELVMYDKQKLITQCLKIFDTNVELVNSVKRLGLAADEAKEKANSLGAELDRLRKLKFWAWVNEWFLSRMKGGSK